MHKNILDIAHLSKVYRSGSHAVRALDDVNLSVHEGEILSLLGVNGAGKTTLSSIIATLHPATSGDILYHGNSIYKNLTTYRHALGFCPQRPNLDPYLSVHDNLLFAGRYYLLPKSTVAKRVQLLMQQFGLERYRDFAVDELSGGWKQRVLIARALVHEPKIVILDEPTVGLDPDIRRQLWDVIRGLKERGITVILTTHYLDEAEQLSDRACILHHGKIMLTESIAQLKRKHQMERLEDIFIKITQENQAE